MNVGKRCYFGCNACALGVSVGDRTACGGKVVRVGHAYRDIEVAWPGRTLAMSASRLRRGWTGLLRVELPA